jgi:hypothetical protein
LHFLELTYFSLKKKKTLVGSLEVKERLVKESGRFFKACLRIEIDDSPKSEHSPTLV